MSKRLQQFYSFIINLTFFTWNFKHLRKKKFCPEVRLTENGEFFWQAWNVTNPKGRMSGLNGNWKLFYKLNRLATSLRIKVTHTEQLQICKTTWILPHYKQRDDLEWRKLSVQQDEGMRETCSIFRCKLPKKNKKHRLPCCHAIPAKWNKILVIKSSQKCPVNLPKCVAQGSMSHWLHCLESVQQKHINGVSRL